MSSPGIAKINIRLRVCLELEPNLAEIPPRLVNESVENKGDLRPIPKERKKASLLDRRYFKEWRAMGIQSGS